MSGKFKADEVNKAASEFTMKALPAPTNQSISKLSFCIELSLLNDRRDIFYGPHSYKIYLFAEAIWLLVEEAEERKIKQLTPTCGHKIIAC